VEQAVLARHGESEFSARGLVNGDVAVPCPLTERGEEEARALGEVLAGEPIDLCVTSEFERARQTADLALGGRAAPRLVLAELNDPRYGVFEGGALDEYREWARSHGSADAPSGGESRRELVDRYARGFRIVLDRPEENVLVVAHSLPIAYALGEPRPRMRMVEHASAHRLSAEELREAVERLEAWLGAPTW
jgi:2,3-bisphosphoglycerate-dependent phosphoglycerate mutase